MKAKEPGFALTTQCNECPWRSDVPVGCFPPERFAMLASSCKQDFAPMFGCHKTAEGREQACVGYLAQNGSNNFLVRIAAMQGRVNFGQLKLSGPQYDGFRAMAIANGFDPGPDPDYR